MQFEQGSTGGNDKHSPNHGGHLPNAGTPVTRRSPESSLHGEARHHDPHPFCVCGSALVDGHCGPCEASAGRRLLGSLVALVVFLAPYALLAQAGGR